MHRKGFSVNLTSRTENRWKLTSVSHDKRSAMRGRPDVSNCHNFVIVPGFCSF